MYVRFRFKTERSVLDKDHLCTLQKIDLPCKKIGKVQTSVPCFDISHKDGPKEQHECTSSKNRDHQSSTFCLMYPSKTESLPSPLDISSVAQEISKNNITKKGFSVDNTFRGRLYSMDALSGRRDSGRCCCHLLVAVARGPSRRWR